MKLRKCPVCGRPVKIEESSYWGYGDETTATIFCDCGLVFSDEELTTEELVKKWNGNEEVEEEQCIEFTIDKEHCDKINLLHNYLNMLAQLHDYGVKSIKITSNPIVTFESTSSPANFEKETLSLVEYDIKSILEFRIENAASEAFCNVLPNELFIYKPYDLLSKYRDFGNTGTPEDSDPIAIILLDCDNNFGMYAKSELRYLYYPQRNKLKRL